MPKTTGARRALSRAGIAAVIIAGVIAGAAPLSAAKDDGEADAKIQTLTVQLKELEVKDTRNAATSEIGQGEALIDKSRSIIGERKQREALTQALEEAEATLSLAEAKIIEADRKAALDEQNSKLSETQNQLKQTKAEVAALEKQQADLDKQLGGGQ